MRPNHQPRLVAGFLLLLGIGVTFGTEPERTDRFRQLDEVLPTANVYRAASGAPGHAYWQQKVDYRIDVTLDDDEQRILGSETVRYHNNSPDTLRYLWVQLDPNIFAPQSHSARTALAPGSEEPGYAQIDSLLARRTFDGGVEIERVADAGGEPLAHTTVGTMMRIDLDRPLGPSSAITFSIDWNYRINDARRVWGRTGFEYFEKDDNYIYEIAQWFPRLAAYTDADGWQNKQFLGRGEFTLEFGDYQVRITAPDDHVVAATGVLQNPDEVLSDEQRARLSEARDSGEPVFIVTPEEALANEASEPEGTKTWEFHAENVRDFAFASSRKFIWDAMVSEVTGEPVLCMSYYPGEGEPLWSRYSTRAIEHTLDVYSRHTFAYPYPVAISVNGPVGGMEYPMICFNGPRPEEDGTYSARTKYGLISVIIHEVGHNWFPMIVNSDERQWTWMDEGLNTFLQFLAEQEWEEKYPSRRGEPRNIVSYMSSDEQVPVMTNSESLLQFGSNAYAKPATALNILRETVMGRELFDFAFREYSNRWRFKRPEPADFFRTMEDASAVDLDWFWRGWFFTTEKTDIAIEGLTRYRIDTRDPDIEKARKRRERDEEPVSLTQARNEGMPRRLDALPQLADFYNEFDELEVTEADRDAFDKLLAGLDEDQARLLETDLNFYVIRLENRGGLVMPVILEVEYGDGSLEELRIPAEVWRRDSQRVSKLILTPNTIERVTLDPHLETADVDLSNNRWPRETEEGLFRLQDRDKPRNPMQKAEAARKEAEKAESAEAVEASAGNDGADGSGR